jgi:hypothetical protein
MSLSELTYMLWVFRIFYMILTNFWFSIVSILISFLVVSSSSQFSFLKFPLSLKSSLLFYLSVHSYFFEDDLIISNDAGLIVGVSMFTLMRSGDGDLRGNIDAIERNLWLLGNNDLYTFVNLTLIYHQLLSVYGVIGSNWESASTLSTSKLNIIGLTMGITDKKEILFIHLLARTFVPLFYGCSSSVLVLLMSSNTPPL